MDSVDYAVEGDVSKKALLVFRLKHTTAGITVGG
jgi:hypothetical protein